MRPWMLGALLLACGDPDKSVTDTDEPITTEPTTGGTTPTGSASGGTTSGTTTTGSGTPTGDPWDVPVDCTQLLAPPLLYSSLPWTPSHEDFTFDATGHMVGVSGGNLQLTPYGGPPLVVAAGVGNVRGTRFMLDGRLAMANSDQGAITAIDPLTGSIEVIAGGLNNPNGIAIGLDGWVYAGCLGQVVRVDPVSHAIEVVLDQPGHSFDGVTFNRDYTRLFANEEVGRLWMVDFDAQGNPGAPVQLPDVPIGVFSLLDGMAVDACDNLYIVEMGGTLWRVTPSLTYEAAVLITEPTAFISSVNFGSGVGGWLEDHVYIMDFTGRTFEAAVGVPGKYEPHLP